MSDLFLVTYIRNIIQLHELDAHRCYPFLDILYTNEAGVLTGASGNPLLRSENNGASENNGGLFFVVIATVLSVCD